MKGKGKNYSVDFMDINWVIDHVKDIKPRIDILKELGYRVGYNLYVNKNKNALKSMIIGKRGELRIQVSEKIPGLPLVYCVMLEDK